MAEDKNMEFFISYFEELKTKLVRIETLKDYAISKNLNVPNEVFENISKIRLFLFEINAIALLPDKSNFDIAKLNQLFSEEAAIDTNSNIADFKRIFYLGDVLERELTSITYPATSETINHSFNSEKINKLKSVILTAASFALISAVILCFFYQKYKITEVFSFMSISLGLLGSSLYIIFNLTGVIKEKVFDINDMFSYYSRLLTGPILGWLFYYAFCQGQNSLEKPVLLLVPFLAGFSTKLVVGVINQLIKTFEMTLGIEDKSKSIAKKTKEKTTAGSELSQ